MAYSGFVPDSAVVAVDLESTKSGKGSRKGKARRTLTHNVLGEYLSSINPYFQTLANPFEVQGVRIPSIVSYPSGTFSISIKESLVVSNNGVFCISAGTSVSNTVSGALSRISGSLIPYINHGNVQYWVSGAGATGASLGINAVNKQLPNWVVPTDTIPNEYRSVRLVSGGISVAYTGNFMQDSGRLIGVFAPPDSLNWTISTLVGVADVQQVPGSRVVSVNKGDGISVLYSPVSQLYYHYVDTQGAIPPDNPETSRGGQLWVCGDGLVPGTVVEAYVVWNFEGLPFDVSNTIVKAENHVCDPIQAAEATMLMAQMGTTVPRFMAELLRSGGCSDGRRVVLNSHVLTPGPNQRVPLFSSPSSYCAPLCQGSDEDSPREQQKRGSMFQKILRDIFPVLRDGSRAVKESSLLG